MRHRIALVITDLEPGGAEQQMVELAVRLANLGFEPIVFVLFPPPGRQELAERLKHAGLTVEYLGASAKWRIPGVIRRLARRLAEVRPQLVQTFLHHANLVASLAARRAGVGRVVTGIRVAEGRWNLHCSAARLTDRFVDCHVCVSSAVAEYAQKCMGLPASKLEVIPNGVDVARFAAAEPISRPELDLPAESRFLLYVGRLDRQKRVDWLLRRMNDVSLRLPSHHLILVGAGPDEAGLKQLAARLGIADRVHFAGWRSDIPRLLAAADLLVLTSAWEGMPNVVLEAMAAGNPVVATDAEGVAEILGPNAIINAERLGSTGILRQLVPQDDKHAFVEAVVGLATAPSLARLVGRGNQARVRETFSLERMAGRYADLYRELLDS